jgi:hypothetical protein
MNTRLMAAALLLAGLAFGGTAAAQTQAEPASPGQNTAAPAKSDGPKQPKATKQKKPSTAAKKSKSAPKKKTKKANKSKK